MCYAPRDTERRTSTSLAQVTAFGAAAYYLTDGFDLPFRPKRRGEPKYWRGQRIDDD